MHLLTLLACALGTDAPPEPGGSAHPTEAGPSAAAVSFAADRGRRATSYAAVHGALRSAKLDWNCVAAVSELVVSAGGGELEMSGFLILLEPVDGRRVGAVFVGQGLFTLDPPHRIEREQLRRTLDSPAPRIELEAAALFFTEAAGAAILERAGAFEPGAILDPAGRALSDALSYLEVDRGGDLDAGLMSALLSAEPWPYLYAYLVPPRGRKFFFRVDERQEETFAFGREARGRGHWFDVLAEYGTEWPGPVAESAESGSLVTTRHVEVEATISGRFDFSARTTLDLEPHVRGGSWVPLWLHSSFQVDSARWETGQEAHYFRLKDGTRLWVRLPEGGGHESTHRLSLWYESRDFLKRDGVWIELASSTGWYPRHGGTRGATTFDLTFRTPRGMAFMSVGEEVHREETDEGVLTRWVTDFPSHHASFNLGWLEEYELADPRIPPVKLQVAERALRRMQIQADMAGDRRVRTRIRDMHERVGADLMNSISFFQTWFGPPPIAGLHATTIPQYHGQAFPGLIHLSWLTFEGIEQLVRRRDLAEDEVFRAHEVAHQWWGLGVRPATYRDTWLSEGIASFAGMWYLQTVLEDPKLYFRRLEHDRRDILDLRDEAGPIALGTRLATSESPEHYWIIVYRKGAWVMHMLRNLFLELDTLAEDRFIEMLRDLYRTYEGRPLSTEEFRAHVERHLGIDMEWFFDQWVYGTEIPRYEVSYRGRELDDGGYGVTLRVEQQQVSPDFQMIVPVLFDFGRDGVARVRVRVAGPVTELEIPPLPGRPDRIVFNEFDSVLADVRDRGWRR